VAQQLVGSLSKIGLLVVDLGTAFGQVIFQLPHVRAVMKEKLCSNSQYDCQDVINKYLAQQAANQAEQARIQSLPQGDPNVPDAQFTELSAVMQSDRCRTWLPRSEPRKGPG
jgi:hypothetical protein